MAITVSEFTPATVASGSSVSTTKTCTAGSAIAVFFWTSEWNSPPTPVLKLDGVVSGTLLESPTAGAGNDLARCWLIENIGGGSHTVNVSGWDTGRAGYLFAVELLGAATASAKDVSASHAASSSSQQFFGAPSPGQSIAAGSCALAFTVITSTPGSLTPDTGYAALTGQDNGTIYMHLIYKVFGSAGTSERGLNQGAGNDRTYLGILLAVKESAGGSSTGAAAHYYSQLSRG